MVPDSTFSKVKSFDFLGYDVGTNLMTTKKPFGFREYIVGAECIRSLNKDTFFPNRHFTTVNIPLYDFFVFVVHCDNSYRENYSVLRVETKPLRKFWVGGIYIKGYKFWFLF